MLYTLYLIDMVTVYFILLQSLSVGIYLLGS